MFSWFVLVAENSVKTSRNTKPNLVSLPLLQNSAVFKFLYNLQWKTLDWNLYILLLNFRKKRKVWSLMKKNYFFFLLFNYNIFVHPPFNALSKIFCETFIFNILHKRRFRSVFFKRNKQTNISYRFNHPPQ